MKRDNVLVELQKSMLGHLGVLNEATVSEIDQKLDDLIKLNAKLKKHLGLGVLLLGEGHPAERALQEAAEKITDEISVIQGKSDGSRRRSSPAARDWINNRS